MTESAKSDLIRWYETVLTRNTVGDLLAARGGYGIEFRPQEEPSSSMGLSYSYHREERRVQLFKSDPDHGKGHRWNGEVLMGTLSQRTRELFTGSC